MMTTLGDLLALARSSTNGFQEWVEASDAKLAEEILAALLADTEEAFTAFARRAVADFTRFADEEAWAHLMTLIRDREDPGAACLAAMVRWRLRAGHCPDHAPVQPQ